MSEKLTDAEQMAISFLLYGPHELGPIRNDEELAAALVFSGLTRRGLIEATSVSPGRVRYALYSGAMQ